MARGRRKIAPELAEKLGNPGRRGKTVAAQPPEEDDPTAFSAPEHVSDGVRAVWDAIVATPVGADIIKSSDRFMLERYCTFVHDWRLLTEALTDRRVKGGLRMFEKHERKRYGTVTKARPEVGMRIQIAAELRAMEREFGLTPSARASIYERLRETGDPSKPNAAPTRQPPAADGKPAPVIPPAPKSPLGLLMSAKAKH